MIALDLTQDYASAGQPSREPFKGSHDTQLSTQRCVGGHATQLASLQALTSAGAAHSPVTTMFNTQKHNRGFWTQLARLAACGAPSQPEATGRGMGSPNSATAAQPAPTSTKQHAHMGYPAPLAAQVTNERSLEASAGKASERDSRPSPSGAALSPSAASSSVHILASATADHAWSCSSPCNTVGLETMDSWPRDDSLRLKPALSDRMCCGECIGSGGQRSKPRPRGTTRHHCQLALTEQQPQQPPGRWERRDSSDKPSTGLRTGASGRIAATVGPSSNWECSSRARSRECSFSDASVQLAWQQHGVSQRLASSKAVRLLLRTHHFEVHPTLDTQTHPQHQQQRRVPHRSFMLLTPKRSCAQGGSVHAAICMDSPQSAGTCTCTNNPVFTSAASLGARRPAVRPACPSCRVADCLHASTPAADASHHSVDAGPAAAVSAAAAADALLTCASFHARARSLDCRNTARARSKLNPKLSHVVGDFQRHTLWLSSDGRVTDCMPRGQPALSHREVWGPVSSSSHAWPEESAQCADTTRPPPQRAAGWDEFEVTAEAWAAGGW